jgi:hypothetical protein
MLDNTFQGEEKKIMKIFADPEKQDVHGHA